ncbi:MAG: 1-phosphofructokinase family hexose kinase [Curvibacter sp.]|nr:1-phosphofructokinase family hexose kinase [Curvibacter sp.]
MSSAPAPDILTLTLNPALDLLTTVERVQPTHKLRCGPALFHPGGGGVNVARVVHRLGAGVRALYTEGGATGRELRALLDQEGVPCEGLPIVAPTRESLSVHETSSGLDWRFVLPGPTLLPAEWAACEQRFVQCGATAGHWVLSGSLPPGVPDDFYARLARQARLQGRRLVLDASGAALGAALAEGVYLVKPSLRELSEHLGRPLDDEPACLAAARQLIDQGQAEIVALTLGERGALLVSARQAWRAPALSVPVASTIGAGDSFVGGLVWALARQDDLEQALRLAMAASAAALLSEGTALCQPAEVQRLRAQVRLEAL